MTTAGRSLLLLLLNALLLGGGASVAPRLNP